MGMGISEGYILEWLGGKESGVHSTLLVSIFILRQYQCCIGQTSAEQREY